MAIDFDTLLDGLISHQKAEGFFEIVTAHEPKSAPGPGVSAASWFQRISPIPSLSGLASTTYRIEWVTRLYTNMLAEDQDEIDPTVLRAVDNLLDIYNGDFQLGGRVMQVDLLGAYGEPLFARAGYLTLNSKLFRIMDVVTPLVVADAYTQAP